jgi:integrase/recombinase XerD
MAGKRTILKDLIIADIDGLNDAALAEFYSIEQKLLNGSALKNIRDIRADNLIDNFFDAHQINSSTNTLYNYRQILRDFLKNVQHNLNIGAISAYLRSKQWGDNTNRRNYILLKRFLDCLFANKYTEIQLSSCITLPSRVRKHAFTPTSKQVSRFIDSIKLEYLDEDDRIRYETIFKIYIKTGIRRTELIDINVEDIDFDTDRIIILKTKNKDVKVINMDDNLKDILLFYLGYFKYKSGPLFRGTQGKRLCKQSLNNSFQKIKARAVMPKEFKIHSFRRYFINQLRKNKVDLPTIKELAGHRDIRTTEIYCNVGEEEKVKALESIRV